MKLEVAQAIVKAAEDLGLEMSVREGYSGRGMFGRTTTGIIYDSEGDLLRCTAQAAADLAAMHYQSSIPDDLMTVEDFIDDLGGLSKDSMGRSMIVY